jgi:hypothetical protein
MSKYLTFAGGILSKIQKFKNVVPSYMSKRPEECILTGLTIRYDEIEDVDQPESKLVLLGCGCVLCKYDWDRFRTKKGSPMCPEHGAITEEVLTMTVEEYNTTDFWYDKSLTALNDKRDSDRRIVSLEQRLEQSRESALQRQHLQEMCEEELDRCMTELTECQDMLRQISRTARSPKCNRCGGEMVLQSGDRDDANGTDGDSIDDDSIDDDSIDDDGMVGVSIRKVCYRISSIGKRVIHGPDMHCRSCCLQSSKIIEYKNYKNYENFEIGGK